MNYKNISLPYPVLGISDDIYPLLKEGECIRFAEPEKTPTDFVFHINLKHENEDIHQLIRDGKAEYACEIRCNQTFLRRCITSSSPFFDVTLSRREVQGRVNFTCFVVAKEPIHGYNNSLFNTDYRGFTFDLEKGDLLVIFPQAYYNTEIKYDKLFAAGSFMQIIEAEQGETDTKFNLDEDRIMIELPHELFVQYELCGNKFPEIVHSSLVHNALVYALLRLDEYKDSGKLWADSLLHRLGTEPALQQYDYADVEDVFALADALLQNPYARLMNSLENLDDRLTSPSSLEEDE